MVPARPLTVARPSAVAIMFRHMNGRPSGIGPGRSEATSTALSPSARSGYRRGDVCVFSGLGPVPRLDPLRAVEGELLLLGLALAADGLEDDRVVVAGGEALDDPPDEPVRQAGDDRAPLRPLVPLAPLELVDLVAGLPAEQLGDLLAVRRDEVHAEVLGALGDLEGVVLVRQPGQEARRIDADLRREADEAARALPVAGDGRDDEHRVVELAHERGERLG